MQNSKRLILILGSTTIALSVMVSLVFGVKAGVPRFSQNQAAGVQLVCQDAAIPYTFCFDDEVCVDILDGDSDQDYITYPFTPTLDGEKIGPTVTAAFVRQQETYNFTTSEETKTNYYNVRLQPFVESVEAGKVVRIDTGEEDGGGERMEFTETVGGCFLRKIDVQLTVSTDEAECGMTSAIDIPQGTNAYFCATVTNNTIVSQTQTTINIPEFGLEGKSTQTLLPGESHSFTSADFPKLGPVAVSGDIEANVTVQSFNRTLVFGVDVRSADEPFETIAVTDSAKVTAVATATHALTVNVIGDGSVTPDSGDFTAGEVVALTAMPDAGWLFDGWSGALTGMDNPATVTMNGEKSITATFIEDPDSVAVESVAISGPTEGRIGIEYQFDVTTEPLTDEKIYDYSITATGHDHPQTGTDGSVTSASFSWASTGAKTIMVTVKTALNSVTAQHTITISNDPSPTPTPQPGNGNGAFLPIVQQ